jgi:hypothetical protein
MAQFTPTQGRYLAFIQAYINSHGYPPAESEIATAMCVAPPSVNQMVKTMEKKGLLLRQPGQPRALRILIPASEIPAWGNRKSQKSPSAGKQPTSAANSALPAANLYVLSVSLLSGPLSKKFQNKAILREIEIRGDQSLDDLHDAIFKAYERWDDHLYEFQFGKRPFDPAGPNYGIMDSGRSSAKGKKVGDARTTNLDDLGLTPGRAFGYWFDFGDDWFHQVQVERIEQAIPTVPYPRVSKRVGKSPPQYEDE